MLALRKWAGTALCVFGILFFAVAALFAARILYTGLRQLLSATEWLGVIALALGAAGAVFAALRLPQRAALGLAIALLILTRTIAVFIDARVFSDWAMYHKLATEIANGGPWLTPDRYPATQYPTGFPILLSPLYALFGPEPVLARLLNCALSLFTGWILYRFVREVWDERAATLALTLFALSPAATLMTSVVATETTYTALLTLAFYTSLRAGKSGSARTSLAGGVVLGLSQYVRTTSMLFLPAFFVEAWFRLSPRAALRSNALMGAGFLLMLIPVMLFNIEHRGKLSLVTSDVGGFSFYIGTNIAAEGSWTLEDGKYLLSFSSSEEANEKATAAAFQRIKDDPAGFLRLIPRKFRNMWAYDGYAVDWAFWDMWIPSVRVLRAASGIYWTLILLAAGAAVFTLRKKPPPWMLLTLGCLATVSALHMFLEVQARYHSYYLPMMIALAAQWRSFKST